MNGENKKRINLSFDFNQFHKSIYIYRYYLQKGMVSEDFRQYLKQHAAEGELLTTIFISLATSFAVLGIAYFANFRYIENFMSKYGFYLLFASLSYALILPSIKEVRAYNEFPCMSGMMVGMTLGAVAGFLPAVLIGATNGMFWGVTFGMVFGITVGSWNGSCCGVMGVIEGTMAGFMGGLMGGMTALMMLNDNLKAAVIIVFMISAIIIVSLNFMIYKEMKGIERKHKDSALLTILFTLVLTSVTMWLMVYGPRSVLFQ